MSESGKQLRLHAVVHGRVQGVNFRAYTQREAEATSLTGWVRNRIDGTVETVAEGAQDSLDRFVQFLHSGPPLASVNDVEIEWAAATGEFSEFKVRYF